MNIEAKKSVLTQRKDSLHSEVVAILDEVQILQALMNKAEQELLEIQIELDKLEEPNTIKLAYAS